jgi:hypothetical protein
MKGTVLVAAVGIAAVLILASLGVVLWAAATERKMPEKVAGPMLLGALGIVLAAVLTTW